MHILGGLETRSGWCFTTAHVVGVANTLADGISRWDSYQQALIYAVSGPTFVGASRGQAGADLCSGMLAASTSTCQLRDHFDGLTRTFFGRLPFAP